MPCWEAASRLTLPLQPCFSTPHPAGPCQPHLLLTSSRSPSAAEAEQPLKRVSVRRYAAALAERRRRAEAEERRGRLVGRVRQLADATLEATGWAQLLGRQPRAKEDAGSGDASLAARHEGGTEGAGGVAVAEPGRRPRVALLTLSGPIVLGPGSSSPMPSPGGLRGSPAQIASLPVIQALSKARLDPAVRAVVLRVDSPGGRPGGGGLAAVRAAAVWGWAWWRGARPGMGCMLAGAPNARCTWEECSGPATQGPKRAPSKAARGRPPLRLTSCLHLIAALSLLYRPAPRAGGSAAASDAIHREVALLRQAGKPVVVSMGNAAASGGYFISAPATKIVAQPGTITGSIGVLMGGEGGSRCRTAGGSPWHGSACGCHPAGLRCGNPPWLCTAVLRPDGGPSKPAAAGKLVFDEALREYGVRTETLKTARNADAMSAVAGGRQACSCVCRQGLPTRWHLCTCGALLGCMDQPHEAPDKRTPCGARPCAQTTRRPPAPRPRTPPPGFDREQRRKVEAMMDDVYARFKQARPWTAGLPQRGRSRGSRRQQGARAGRDRLGTAVLPLHQACAAVFHATGARTRACTLPSPLHACPSPSCCTPPQVVAEGRGLSQAQVSRLAKGRVWTGEQVRLVPGAVLGGTAVCAPPPSTCCVLHSQVGSFAARIAPPELCACSHPPHPAWRPCRA